MNFLSIEQFINTSYFYYLNRKYSNGATKKVIYLCIFWERQTASEQGLGPELKNWPDIKIANCLNATEKYH